MNPFEVILFEEADEPQRIPRQPSAEGRQKPHTPTAVPKFVDTTQVGMLRVLIVEFYAAFVTGRELTKHREGTGSADPLHVGEMWVQNLWINLRFDALVRLATNSNNHNLPPDLHALLLALGLAQFQTTWRWPYGEIWPRWFAGDPPTHWLAAHVWHLCWAAAEPDDPTRLAGADWPELAADLAEFEFRFDAPTSAT